MVVYQYSATDPGNITTKKICKSGRSKLYKLIVLPAILTMTPIELVVHTLLTVRDTQSVLTHFNHHKHKQESDHVNTSPPVD